MSEKVFANAAESQLAMVIEASDVVSSELAANMAFKNIFEILKWRHGVIRGVVFLLDVESQEIRVGASTGLGDTGRAAYHWPGNVRELENVIERAVLVCDSNVLHGHHLPPT